MRVALVVLSLGAALLACGSEGEADPAASESRSASVTERTAPSELSSAQSAPPRLEASSTVSNDDQVDTSAPVESSTPERGAESIDAQIPIISIDGEQRDEPVPYFGRQNPSGGVTDPAPGFKPAAADEEFCSAVSLINSRPQPRDDFEEIVVGAQYFSAIERYVPAELAESFAEVVKFASSIVEAGSFEDADEPADSDAVSTALQAINDFVDPSVPRACLTQASRSTQL